MSKIIVSAEKSEIDGELNTYVRGMVFCCLRMANAYFIGTVRLKNPELYRNIKPELFVYAKNEDLEQNNRPVKYVLDKCNFCGEEIEVCAFDTNWEPIPVKTSIQEFSKVGPFGPFKAKVLDEEDIWKIIRNETNYDIDEDEDGEEVEEDEKFSDIMDAIRNDRKTLNKNHLKYVSKLDEDDVGEDDLDYIIDELRESGLFFLNKDMSKLTINDKKNNIIKCLKYYM